MQVMSDLKKRGTDSLGIPFLTLNRHIPLLASQTSHNHYTEKNIYRTKTGLGGESERLKIYIAINGALELGVCTFVFYSYNSLPYSKHASKKMWRSIFYCVWCVKVVVIIL